MAREARGGARLGSGRKRGKAGPKLKDGSLVHFAPQMLVLAQEWLESENKSEQRWAFERLLPYVFRKPETNIRLNFALNKLEIEEVTSELANQL